MKHYKLSEITLFVLLAVISTLLVGCVVCDSDIHYTGIEDETLKKIECGKTTKDQLVELLGEPSEQSLMEDGAEILRYKCTKKHDSKVVVFPIVFVDEEKETKHTVAFEVKDGIVQRYKKER